MSWRIFQRLFNVPPRKDSRYFTDKSGEKFWIDWDVEQFEYIAELHVVHRGRWVGLLSLLRERDGSLILRDMILLERYKQKEQDLDNAMLGELIRWAEANNFKRIVGIITPRAGSTLKSLTEWYEQQGFSVKDRRIFLELKGARPSS
jgi:hypothetical protein